MSKDTNYSQAILDQARERAGAIGQTNPSIVQQTRKPEPTKQIDFDGRKLIYYRGDRGACWYVRGHMPLSQIAKKHPDKYHIEVSSVLSSEHVGIFDVAIFQRQYKAEIFHPMLEMKKRGTKVIFEIDDDLFNVPKWNPSYNVLGKKSVKENVKYFISNVDAIFVTTEYLKKLYSPYCEHIYVLPNSVDKSIMMPSPNNSLRKVVCWQGSNTHEKDLSLIRPAINKLVQDEDTFIKMWSYDIPGTYKIPWCPLEFFYSMLAQLDGYIGLAPLTTIPFNKSKSNLKFLEYAAQGIVTIASNFGPYAETIEHDVTGYLIDDNRDWYDVIRHLLENEDEHERIASNARNFVNENYNIENTYKLWVQAIEEILGGSK